jgi:hypothetical protein
MGMSGRRDRSLLMEEDCDPWLFGLENGLFFRDCLTRWSHRRFVDALLQRRR